MCHFITLIFPKKCKQDRLIEVFRNYHMPLGNIENEYVTNQIPKGYKYYNATQNMCDCGTPIGSSYRNEILSPTDMEKEISKLRRKGWSETKIARWQENQKHSDLKKERENRATHDKMSPDIAVWENLFKYILENKISESFGILLHWYNDGLFTEKIDFKGIEENSISKLNRDILLNFREDIVYIFNGDKLR